MAKKDFSDNPAMAYLSSTGEKKSSETKESKPRKKATQVKTEVQKIAISVPEKKETKSKQIHLLVKPSNYEKLKKAAKKSGRSVNDFVNAIIEQL